MSLRDNELARRQEGRLELRPQPIRVRWAFRDLAAEDGHELRVQFTCSARAIADPAERRMLEEVLFGSRYSVTDEDVSAHFEPTLRQAAAGVAAKHPAQQWVAGEFRNELTAALQKAAEPVAFGCGLEILPPFSLELSSPTLDQQRLRAMQQAVAEKQAAGRMEHVHRAAELLKQFQSIRQSAPELSPGRVLQQINPADQGDVLRTLLLASSDAADRPDLWAVAGPYLVRIDPAEGSPRTQLYPLPPTLGPTRSVRAARVGGDRRLLVGARSGFLLVDPQSPAEAHAFVDPAAQSALGFNSVVYAGPELGFVASHGDAGVVAWNPRHPEAPAAALRTDRLSGRNSGDVPSAGGSVPGPKNLQPLDAHHVIFSIGSRLFVTDMDRVDSLSTESSSAVLAILPDDARVIVVHEDGSVFGIDRGTRAVTGLMSRGERLCSAGLLPWLGTVRLLLAADRGAVDCIGLDDPLLTQYLSPHRGMRVIAGSADRVAGVSGDRQRLILWQSWDARQPAAEVYLTGLTRHRVADIAFG